MILMTLRYMHRQLIALKRSEIIKVKSNMSMLQINKLLEGNQYYFRVQAQNEAGVGRATETAQLVDIKSAHGTIHRAYAASLIHSCDTKSGKWRFSITIHVHVHAAVLLISFD